MDQIQHKFETIQVELKGTVAYVTINRPKALNALNQQVIDELEEAIFQIISPSNTRVMVLAGAGDKAFVAGADIAAMAQMTAEQALAFARHGQTLTRALESLPQLTIARVHGFALGGGCELAMACDVIVASTKAKFSQPEVGLGLIPGFGGTQRLIRRVGPAIALDMLCTGRHLTGTEALTFGLVSRVAEPDRIDDEINRVIKGALHSAPGAIAEAKRLARESYSMSLDAGLNAEASAFATRFSQAETSEGLRAFLEKRSPSFSE